MSVVMGNTSTLSNHAVLGSLHRRAIDDAAGDVGDAMAAFLAGTDPQWYPSDTAVQSRVTELADDVERIDGWCGTVAAALREADAGLFGLRMVDVDMPSAPLPPGRSAVLDGEALAALTMAPADIAAWWDELSTAEREYLARENPGDLAGLDGIDVGTRDALNRAELLATISDLRDRERELSEGGWTSRIDVPFLHDNPDELEDVRSRLRALEQIVATDGYVLLFDNDGDGLAAVSFGDPSAASHVSVQVPGISNDLDNYPGLLRNAERMQEYAEEVSMSSVATIAWLGYDTPGGPNSPEFVHAPLGGRAVVGAEALRLFQQGLTALAPDGQHLTVIGHSYGSHVTADAIRIEGLEADDYVLVGSPGAGVNHVSELGAPDGSTVWAESVGSYPDQQPPVIEGPFGVPMENPLAPTLGQRIGDAISRHVLGEDPVPVTPSTHGRNPDEPGFGAAGFALGDAEGHSQYFGTDDAQGNPVINESLRSMTSIVLDDDMSVLPPEDGA